MKYFRWFIVLAFAVVMGAPSQKKCTRCIDLDRCFAMPNNTQFAEQNAAELLGTNSSVSFDFQPKLHSEFWRSITPDRTIKDIDTSEASAIHASVRTID